MKATGIVRRIDELGRIVIPKEIRRTLRIREGDPLEIFTNHEGGIILKKYSHRRTGRAGKRICGVCGERCQMYGLCGGQGPDRGGSRTGQEKLFGKRHS